VLIGQGEVRGFASFDHHGCEPSRAVRAVLCRLNARRAAARNSRYLQTNENGFRKFHHLIGA
jgi:hypothetical protein